MATLGTQRDQVIELLRSQGMMRLSEFKVNGITAATIGRMVRGGDVIRLARGLYQLPDAPLDANHSMAEAAKRIPRGVVCLVSALSYHELTDQLGWPDKVTRSARMAMSAPGTGLPKQGSGRSDAGRTRSCGSRGSRSPRCSPGDSRTPRRPCSRLDENGRRYLALWKHDVDLDRRMTSGFMPRPGRTFYSHGTRPPSERNPSTSFIHDAEGRRKRNGRVGTARRSHSPSSTERCDDTMS